MRPVKGFDRPGVQWIFLALAVALTVAVGTLSGAVWRLNGTIRALRAAALDERVGREQLEARIARERSTREALSLELARLRGPRRPGGGADAIPTLTLQPLRAREATPPPPTVSAPPATAVIELRLVLPSATEPKIAIYQFTVRDWVTGEARLTRGELRAARSGGDHIVAAYVTGDVFAAGSYEVLLKTSDTDVAAYEVTAK